MAAGVGGGDSGLGSDAPPPSPPSALGGAPDSGDRSATLSSVLRWRATPACQNQSAEEVMQPVDALACPAAHDHGLGASWRGERERHHDLEQRAAGLRAETGAA
jgi:hypothetical protein